jgi:diadenosine tetraphosphatase ApaH/serine/threonine PP2A family protein phosphatase
VLYQADGVDVCQPRRGVLAVLYDIHGNLPALEEVLKDADAAGAEGYLLGGDFAPWSPWPRETLETLRALPNTTWIRGNLERWLRELPIDQPDVAQELEEADSGVGDDEGWLYSLQTQVELDGVLYVHGSPLSDVESFPPEPGHDDERLLKGVRGKTVVFGHSHLQFKRLGAQGTTLVNPGSAGMPLDGDVRAAYALQHDDGAFEFRRVEYDIERAAQAWDAKPGFGKVAAARLRKGSD